MTSTTKRVFFALMGIALLLPTSGCNIVAPIFYFAVGPPEYDPEFSLSKDMTTVVFVDDPRSEIPRRAIRIAMIQAAEEDIMRKNLVEDLVSGQSALRVAQTDQSAGQMSVAEIGRAVDSDVVIWATIDSFVRADTTKNQEPRIVFRVRVVDASDNKVLWPSDPAGRRLEVTLTPRIGTVANDSGARTTAELQLGKNAGQAVGQLFYEHLVSVHISESGN
jgi:hypothetical protein